VTGAYINITDITSEWGIINDCISVFFNTGDRQLYLIIIDFSW
jgi:hypothetical protein